MIGNLIIILWIYDWYSENYSVDLMVNDFLLRMRRDVFVGVVECCVSPEAIEFRFQARVGLPK
jgi:hypothetical protein